MNISAIRRFVNDHPEGVLIRMVDGTEYNIPHRDYVWFTPDGGRVQTGWAATSFYVAHEGLGRLVNALLVADVRPLQRRPNGKRRQRPRTTK